MDKPTSTRAQEFCAWLWPSFPWTSIVNVQVLIVLVHKKYTSLLTDGTHIDNQMGHKLEFSIFVFLPITDGTHIDNQL